MEELDQVQENLFEEENEENIFEDTPVEEKEEPQWSLRVKYNGEDRDLNEEDARAYAQKGMNYDKIYNPIERLAKLNNMSVNDYLNQLNDTQIQYEVSKEVDKLRNDSKYEGLSDEILEEIANSRVKESMGVREKTYETQQKAEADAENAKVQRDIDMFMEEYPEFRNKGPEALDPKVFDYVKKGYTLLEAYNKYLRENPQTKASRLNEENRRKSLGNTTNAGREETDDFLSGFLKG